MAASKAFTMKKKVVITAFPKKGYKTLEQEKRSVKESANSKIQLKTVRLVETSNLIEDSIIAKVFQLLTKAIVFVLMTCNTLSLITSIWSNPIVLDDLTSLDAAQNALLFFEMPLMVALLGLLKKLVESEEAIRRYHFFASLQTTRRMAFKIKTFLKIWILTYTIYSKVVSIVLYWSICQPYLIQGGLTDSAKLWLMSGFTYLQFAMFLRLMLIIFTLITIHYSPLSKMPSIETPLHINDILAWKNGERPPPVAVMVNKKGGNRYLKH